MACNKELIKRWLGFLFCPSCDLPEDCDQPPFAWLCDLSSPANCGECGLAMMMVRGNRPLLFLDKP